VIDSSSELQCFRFLCGALAYTHHTHIYATCKRHDERGFICLISCH